MTTGASFAISANLFLLCGMRLLRVSPERISDAMLAALMGETVGLIVVRIVGVIS